ncbi:MAG: HD domain-containing protein [Pseudobdellovibrionaceae bacterium]
MKSKKFTKLSDLDNNSCQWYLKKFENQHHLMPVKVIELLNLLKEDREYSGINQMQHALQTATFAINDSASEEWVFAALCHDVGKVLSQENHAAISAEFIKPYVSEACYRVVQSHEIFQGQFYFDKVGKDPLKYKTFSNEIWYEMGLKFNEWDEKSFDPSMKTVSVNEMETYLETNNKKFPKSLKKVA